jgi:hypothetical protein
MLPSCNANQSRISSPNPDPSPETPTIAFGKKAWEDYFGAVDEEPALPDNINEILHSDCPFRPGKKIKETHLLVMIPSTVNNEPFTLHQLRPLSRNPKKGNLSDCVYNSKIKSLMRDLGREVALQPYWILMTRKVVENDTRNSLSLKDKYPEYDYPKVLEAATVILTHYVRNGAWLYEEEFTSCQEVIKDDRAREMKTFVKSKPPGSLLAIGHKRANRVTFEDDPSSSPAQRRQALLRKF